MLAGDGLVLRPWAESDAPAVRKAFADPDIQRWHLRRLDDLAEARQWTAAWSQRWEAGTDASWAITIAGGAPPAVPGSAALSAGASAVGQVGLRTIYLGEGSAEVSYWAIPAARGQRVAARAVAIMCAWVFGELGLHRLTLMHSTANPRSCAAALRAGFVAEGTLREHLHHSDGWHDMHLHGRLASDLDPPS